MEKGTEVARSDYMEMMPITQAQNNYSAFSAFVKSVLKEDLDYGTIPGTAKSCLYKAGAEKLRFVYGLGVEMISVTAIVDRINRYVDFTYKCVVKTKAGQIVAECEGNCSSDEVKYSHVWKSINELPEGFSIDGLQTKVSGKKLQEFEFAIEKAETTGNYGKPQEYWQMWRDAIESGAAKHITRKTQKGKEMPAWELDTSVTLYKVPNPDVLGLKNTIMKMAQKRAFVGAMLIATGASEYFTQDLDDMDIPNIDGNYAGVSQSSSPPSSSNGYVTDLPFEDMPDTNAGKDKTGSEKEEPVKEPKLPGHWYAKLEKCKTQKDIDELALKNKETVAANQKLRDLFMEYKAKLPK